MRASVRAVIGGTVLASALGIPADAAAQRTFPGGPPMPGGDSTVVITLGTGTPVPNPERAGPATAVLVGSRVFLFDAGPGVVRRMAGAGLPIDGVTAAFITHLHSDHTLGFPDLIFTTWTVGRRIPLRVYGPPGLVAMTNHLLAAWAEDTVVRISGLERNSPGGYRVDAREVRAGVVYDSGGVRVTAVAVPHGNWPVALAYRIDTPNRSVMIAGDTRYSASLAEAARGVDVLVHEVYIESRVAPEQRPGGEFWPQYMREFHTSEAELAQVAAIAKPKLLLLSHVLFLGGTEEELLAGIRRGGFGGAVRVAIDLGRY